MDNMDINPPSLEQAASAAAAARGMLDDANSQYMKAWMEDQYQYLGPKYIGDKGPRKAKGLAPLVGQGVSQGQSALGDLKSDGDTKDYFEQMFNEAAQKDGTD